jgi:uncharacterized protein YdeI (YjbR/CyaY-like superfamily)
MPTEPGEVLDFATAKEWRAWLRRNHRKAPEAWLVYHAKASGRPSIPYNAAVDEALCFGWIDSKVRRLDAHRRAQRFTPRRPGSPVSEMNLARVRRLVREKRMTKAGLDAIGGMPPPPRVRLAPDVRAALQEDPETWRHYRRFPTAYKAIRIGWIEAARGRPAVFRQRLAHFVKMTKANKRFGMVRE